MKNFITRHFSVRQISDLFLCACVTLLFYGYAADNAVENELSYYSKTFKFGTTAEITAALSRIQSRIRTDKEGGKFKEVIKPLYSPEHDVAVLIALFDLTEKEKLLQYHFAVADIIKKISEKEGNLSRNDTLLIAAGIRIIVVGDSAEHNRLILEFFTDSAKHRDNPAILYEAISAMAFIKPVEHRERLKALYKENNTESIRQSVIRAIAACAVEEDIPFIEKIVYDESESEIVRWVAAVALKEFAPSKKALTILRELFNGENFNLKSRALYAMSFFKDEDILPLLIRASRDDRPEMRIQAIKALAVHNTKEITELLKYRFDFDTDAKVKVEAEIILKERGVITNR